MAFLAHSAMRPKNAGTILAKLVAAGLLFGALARHPYDYYRIMRWVVCGVCGFAAFEAGQLQRPTSICDSAREF